MGAASSMKDRRYDYSVTSFSGEEREYQRNCGLGKEATSFVRGEENAGVISGIHVRN